MLSPYEKETYFNFNEAEKEAVVFTYNASLIRKLKNAMDEYPAIQLIRENEDGSCQFVVPKNGVKCLCPVFFQMNKKELLLNV